MVDLTEKLIIGIPESCSEFITGNLLPVSFQDREQLLQTALQFYYLIQAHITPVFAFAVV